MYKPSIPSSRLPNDVDGVLSNPAHHHDVITLQDSADDVKKKHISPKKIYKKIVFKEKKRREKKTQRINKHFFIYIFQEVLL